MTSKSTEFRTGFRSFTPEGYAGITVLVSHNQGEYPDATTRRKVDVVCAGLIDADARIAEIEARCEVRVASAEREAKTERTLAQQAIAERDEARSKVPAVKRRLFGEGTVRFDEYGKLWLMDKREQGWGSFGLHFDSWDELFRQFDVRVTRHGSDDAGPWWAVVSMGEKP